MKERYGSSPAGIHERSGHRSRTGRRRPSASGPRRHGVFDAQRVRRSSKAIAAAEAEYGTLDQLFELVAKGRVLDVVLPRQGSDPAARLNLEAEGESTIGSRLVGADVAQAPREESVSCPASCATRICASSIPRSSPRAGAGSGGALKRPTARHKRLRGHAERPRRQRPAAARARAECSNRPDASSAESSRPELGRILAPLK